MDSWDENEYEKETQTSEHEVRIELENLNSDEQQTGKTEGRPLRQKEKSSDYFDPIRLLEQLDEAENKRSNRFCRICHQSDSEEPFLEPCDCRGTLSQVHKSCLEHWLASSDSSRCEICGHIYVTHRTPRYNYLPSIVIWLRNEEINLMVEFVYDIMSLCVFTPTALLGTYVGFLITHEIEITEIISIVNIDKGIGLLTEQVASFVISSLMIFIDVVYMSWLCLRIKYHVGNWHKWWKRQCTVELVLPSG